MARVVKVFGTLRNHWKKSTVAACALSYGGHWLYGKHWCVTFPSELPVWLLDQVQIITSMNIIEHMHTNWYLLRNHQPSRFL